MSNWCNSLLQFLQQQKCHNKTNTFIYNGKEYQTDWNRGYAQLGNIYLIADFINGKPENVRKVMLFIRPQEVTVIHPAQSE